MISPLNRKALRDLARLKGQMLTLTLLVGTGVALFFASWSSYESLLATRDRFYADNRFADLFVHLKRAPVDLRDVVERVQGVRQAEARLTETGMLEIAGQDEPVMAQVVSFPAAPESSLNAVRILSGDRPRAADQVLVHQSFARAQGLKIGDSLDLLLHGQLRRFQVCGTATSPEFVYALNPAAPLPDDLHFGVFWIDQDAFRRILGMSDAFNDLLIGVADPARIPQIKLEVDRLLAPYGALKTVGRDQQLSARLVADELRQQQAMAVFMPVLFLAVAAFILNIIISRFLALQRSQIGMLKAIGYGNAEIGGHYLMFVLTSVSLSALPGLGLGYVMGLAEIDLYKRFFAFPEMIYQPQGTSIAISLLLILACALVGGGASILRAIRLSPAEAMRPPMPESYTARDAWEAGLNIDQRMRMSLRNLLRRPLRTALTVAGIASGLALMVMALGWRDVLDSMIATQFQDVQREDMNVTFLEPRLPSVLREIGHLPGVLMVEGSREVPIFLRYRHHGQNTVLIGIDGKSELRRLLDGDFRRIEISGTGLVLSSRFAQKWGLRAGDEVEIERLDGMPGTRHLVVTGFVNDFMGEMSYLEISELWRVLGEEPVYSSANLLIDRNRSASINWSLRQRPEISSVATKDVLVKGLMSSVGGMILGFVGILSGFAVAMVIGVVYNSVRIGFAERAWEFAGLRVLGFSVAEVFAVLWYEYAFALLISIVPGLIFGFWLTAVSLTLVHTESFNFPMVIFPSSYGISVLVLLAGFGISLAIAYLMVKRLKLVEALKARE